MNKSFLMKSFFLSILIVEQLKLLIFKDNVSNWNSKMTTHSQLATTIDDIDIVNEKESRNWQAIALDFFGGIVNCVRKHNKILVSIFLIFLWLKR